MKTIEQKALAYDKALEKAKRLYEKGTITESLCHIFPELQESEDEMIRKELIKEINGLWENDSATWPSSLEKKNKYIAWLEKQVVQKEIDYNEELKKCKDNPLYFFDKYVKVKLKENKPAWSEEDETRLQACLDTLQVNSLMGKVDTVMTNWLKSLKDRYTWKPSDEQMKALHNLNLTGNLSYAGQGQVLIELYNDLKKLKG